MMNFLRRHWYDLGGFFSIIVIAYLYLNYRSLSNYQLLMWCSLVSLFFHQLEEYRIAGTFPGMINRKIYNSAMPDRYPLNPNTALYINAGIGWGTYLLAAIFAEQAVWLGIATLMISAGNILAHTFLFNFKGKTLYNAGMATSWLLFAPCICFFIHLCLNQHLLTLTALIIGVALGMVLNFVGVLKMIDWFADKHTSYVFEQYNLLKEDRS